MSTHNEDEENVISEAERIARMSMSNVSFEEYQQLLFSVAVTLSAWRSAMEAAGYTEYLIEKSAWLILTSFYGHHLTTTEIDFEPVQNG